MSWRNAADRWVNFVLSLIFPKRVSDFMVLNQFPFDLYRFFSSLFTHGVKNKVFENRVQTPVSWSYLAGTQSQDLIRVFSV